MGFKWLEKFAEKNDHIPVYAKVFWTTQDIRSDVINEHTGPDLILSDQKPYVEKKVKHMKIPNQGTLRQKKKI
jgi:hypothetical protein